jgi:hypothetical protein
MSEISEGFELAPVLALDYELITCVVCGHKYAHAGLLLELRRSRDGERHAGLGCLCPACLGQGADRAKEAAGSRAEEIAFVAAALQQVQNWPEIPGHEGSADFLL